MPDCRFCASWVNLLVETVNRTFAFQRSVLLAHSARNRHTFELSRVMPNVMPLLHVMRHMRLGLRKRCGRGGGLGKRQSAQAQSGNGGKCECKLLHGYSPWDG